MSFFDLALVYDPTTRSCDLALGDDGDLIVDETSLTPMLLSVGLDRRAAEDDPLPAGRSEWLASAGIAERRGWAGDALDTASERIGSRLWLLDRAKATETTRLIFLMWLDEAMAWAKRETGQAAELAAEWLRPKVLGWRVRMGDDSIEMNRRLD